MPGRLAADGEGDKAGLGGPEDEASSPREHQRVSHLAPRGTIGESEFREGLNHGLNHEQTHEIAPYEYCSWWTGRDLNPRPPDCKSGDHTTDLPARSFLVAELSILT